MHQRLLWATCTAVLLACSSAGREPDPPFVYGESGSVGSGRTMGYAEQTVEATCRDESIVTGYRLPYAAGLTYGVVQYPHAYNCMLYNAIDFGMPRGQAVVAIANGTIKTIVDTVEDYAEGKQCNRDVCDALSPCSDPRAECNAHTNYLIVENDDGNESVYLHLAKNSVTDLNLTKDSRVCRGQIIGRIGLNGYTYGPHLHLSVQPSGNLTWSSIFTSYSKVIYFDEVGAEVEDDASYTSQNHPTCDVPDVPAACFSHTLGRLVTENECVQVSYANNPCGSACALNRCDSNGNWVCSGAESCSTTHAHAACGNTEPPPVPTGCFSPALNQTMGVSECVELNDTSCGESCKSYARCNAGGGFTCVASSACAVIRTLDVCRPPPDVNPGPTCYAPQPGAYCGNDEMANAEANRLYQCPGPGKAPSSSVLCPSGCVKEAPGTPDHCYEPPTGPMCGNTGVGYYCGNDNMTHAVASTLYHCPGSNRAPDSATPCPSGRCVVEAPGTPDHCG